MVCAGSFVAALCNFRHKHSKSFIGNMKSARIDNKKFH
jgi:hypothetical protein